jgi:glycosyltransferase involved in cell wall biosynthesis
MKILGHRGAGNLEPRVSIGMPLYNAERFLEESLDSLMSQTLADFELIISDNASSDGTLEICERFAASDPRIRLTRNDENRGASYNYNKVFALARAPLFKWAADDDLCAPDFLRRCVEALDERPEAVLSYSKAVLIDESGEALPAGEARACVDSQDLSRRFADSLSPMKLWQNPIFGVIRRRALSRTRLIGPYLASDRCLVAHLTLMGPFVEIQEPLFYRRKHSRNIGIGPEDMEFFLPRACGRFLVPEVRVMREHLRNIGETDLSRRKKWTLGGLVWKWAWRRRGVFRRQFRAALRRSLGRKGRGKPDGHDEDLHGETQRTVVRDHRSA